MKRAIIFVKILLNFSFYSYSQDPIEDQVKALQLNSSPAYVILAVEPENIQRPNSPADFVANVQSAIVNERLQPNFAMETSPYYWGRKKPDSKKFNALDFIFNNNYGVNLLRSITFSFATSPTDSFTFGKIPIGTGIGLGMHVQLVQGKVSRNVFNNLFGWYEFNHMHLAMEQIIVKMEADSTIDDIDQFMDEIFEKGSYKNLPAKEKDRIKYLLIEKFGKNSFDKHDFKLLRKMRDETDSTSEGYINKVNEYQFPLTREGFMLELSVANASVAAESKWDSLRDAKTAIWLTPSYRFNVNKDPAMIDIIDLMAVIRITFNNREVDISNYIDVGGKLQWIHNRMSLSAEGIYRYLSKKPESQAKNYSFRTGITLSYKLNELVTFKSTFGSNFDGNSTQYDEPSKLFIVGGFNFGFSNFLKNDKK